MIRRSLNAGSSATAVSETRAEATAQGCAPEVVASHATGEPISQATRP